MASSMTGSTPKYKDVIPEGYDVAQLRNYDPQQMELYKQQFQHVGPDSYLSRLAGGDQSMMAEMEAPALRQFNELQGGLASRFSGAGMGSRRSSGFQNASTAAASNFAQDLQAKRQEMQRQAIQDLMGASNTILGQKPYERSLIQQQEEQKGGGWGGAATGAMSGASMGASFGPYGALAGGVIGGAMGYFSK